MNTLKVSRVLHAGYVFECEGTQIIFDPVFENPFSRNCYAFPQVRFDEGQIRRLKPAAVFISHYHDDHCSLESLALLDRETPIYLYCLFDELFELIKELGFQQVHALKLNIPVSVGPFEVTPRRALDADVDSLFQIRAAGLNVLNVVDSWIDYETLELLVREGLWDLVLWPFQTMRELDVLSPQRAHPASLELPPEWVEQIKALNPRYIVPSSCQFTQEPWSWYNHAMFPITYRQFEQEMATALPRAKVVRMNPSTSVVLNSQSLQFTMPLSWVLPLGEQDVDYEYRDDLKIPTTAVIAQHFVPLTGPQTMRVLEYCSQGLIGRWKFLAPGESVYFERTRIWQLTIYDHRGEGIDFYYRVNNRQIEPVPEGTLPVAWATEIPMAKLYAALELGEALTSMYMRINDCVFEPEVEAEIQEADIVEDPLMRALFHGSFGAYQKAQLKKLKTQEA